MHTSCLSGIAVAALAGAAMATLSHEHFHDRRQITLQYPKGADLGCYSSEGGGMVAQAPYYLQTSDWCAQECQAANMPVMALYAQNGCSCGSLLPSPSDQVDESMCSSPCFGFPAESCGGPTSSGYYTIWLTGTSASVGTVSDDSVSSSSLSSSSSKSTTNAPSTSTIKSSAATSASIQPTTAVQTISDRVTVIQSQSQIQKTIVQTVPVSATANSADGAGASAGTNSKGGNNTVGIAVGVIAGVVGLFALIGGVLLFLRRRRRMKNAENGHARANSLNAFVASGGTLPGIPTIPQKKLSITDSRLDPRIMVQNKRQSAGSVFADNQDYSRRILKVANPDDL